jgi:hypothetical protein
MSEPLEFRIVQSLQTALRGISVGSGYHYDVEALAVKLDPNHNVEDLVGSEGKRPFVILALSPDLFTYYPAGQLRLQMPFIIHAVHDADPTDDDARLQTYFRLCADVEAAIAADGTRGELATDTRILEREMHEMDGQQVWAMVKGEVLEHRGYGAPNG